jgi:hypothetical protein
MNNRLKNAVVAEIALVVDRLISIDGTVVAEVPSSARPAIFPADRLVEFHTTDGKRLAIGALAGEHRETRTHGRLKTSDRFGRTTMSIVETETLVRTYVGVPAGYRAVDWTRDARLTKTGTKVPVLGLNLDVLA